MQREFYESKRIFGGLHKASKQKGICDTPRTSYTDIYTHMHILAFFLLILRYSWSSHRFSFALPPYWWCLTKTVGALIPWDFDRLCKYTYMCYRYRVCSRKLKCFVKSPLYRDYMRPYPHGGRGSMWFGNVFARNCIKFLRALQKSQVYQPQIPCLDGEGVGVGLFLKNVIC